VEIEEDGGDGNQYVQNKVGLYRRKEFVVWSSPGPGLPSNKKKKCVYSFITPPVFPGALQVSERESREPLARERRKDEEREIFCIGVMYRRRCYV